MGPFYVTTPIFYVNDAPHIGHAYNIVCCDALARWYRLFRDPVFFLTGTDEHGLKVQRAAEAQGRTPREHADITSERFRETWQLLNISYDEFIRTTEPRHYTAVQKFLQKIHDNGDIYLGSYEGLYCVSCEAYYNEDDLVDGNCPIHKRPVELLSEENYFFRLSKYEQPLLDFYSENPGAIIPESKRNEALGLIRQGLQDISISRTSITWGVPVPWDEKHVFYVWYDALINYATAVGYGDDRERFDEWWPVVNHAIGKDILRFHCVYWPAMLLAAGEAPAKRIAVHGFLLAGGEKISKTGLNATQITPQSLVDEVGVDAVRYHLLRNPYGPDGEFSFEGLIARYNADLANNFGNLASRVATVVSKKCDGVGPAPRAGSPLSLVAQEVFADTAQGWDDFQPNAALEATWRLIRETNAYLEANEPWKAEPGPELDAVMGDALEALRIVSLLASPALPEACAEVWRRIGLPGAPSEQRLPEAAAWGGYPGGLPVDKGSPLFPRK